MLFVLRPNKEGHLLYSRNLTKIPPPTSLAPILKKICEISSTSAFSFYYLEAQLHKKESAIF